MEMESAMSERHFGPGRDDPFWSGASPSEDQSHSEHRAALDATVFGNSGAREEFLLELDAGQLRFLAVAPHGGGRDRI
jgi:hypothetical protein